MINDVFLCMDFGSTNLKYFVFDDFGLILKKGYKNSKNLSLFKLFALIDEVLYDLKDEFYNRIVGISISSLSPKIALLHREIGLLDEVLVNHKNDLNTKSFFLPYIIAFKEENPALYEHIDKFLFFPEVFLYYLCGQLASAFVFEELEDCFYKEDDFRLFNLDKNKFLPPNFGFPLFLVKDEIVQKFSLKKGAKVVLTPVDYYSSVLGAGFVNKDEVFFRTGTFEGINYLSDKKIHVKGFYVQNSFLQGKFNYSKILNSGEILSFVCELFKIVNPLSYIQKLKFPSKIFFIFPKESDGYAYFSKDEIIKKAETHSENEVFVSCILSIFFYIKSSLLKLKKHDFYFCKATVSGYLSESNFLNSLRAFAADSDIFTLSLKESEIMGNFIILKSAFTQVQTVKELIDNGLLQYVKKIPFKDFIFPYDLDKLYKDYTLSGNQDILFV